MKEILMTECLASARTIYRKLKHLHQTEWELCRISDHGIWRIVPSRNAMYVWYDYNNYLVSIALDNEDNFTTYDLKLFIKVMKKILRRKNFDLRYEY